MMSLKLPFLTLRRHIELDVYTKHGGVHEGRFFGKPERNSHMAQPPLAEGKSSKSFQARPVSISSCYGILEARKRGVFLKSWTDWELTINNNEVSCNAQMPDLLHIDDNHTPQGNGFAEKHSLKIIKCIPPFQVKCEEDVHFVMSQSPFSPQCLSFPSGVTSFKHQHAVNFFMYLNSVMNARWNFKAGEDIMMFVPLSDRPLKVNNHYDPDTYAYLSEVNTPLRDRFAFSLKRKSLADV